MILSLLIYAFILLLFTFYYREIINLPRDLHITYKGAKALFTQKYWEYKNYTVINLFQNQRKKHGNKPALKWKDEVWTFNDVESKSNKISRFFKNEGIKKGDSVALLMEGKPVYVAIWLGIAKIRGVTALINFNQTKDVLKRSLDTSKADWLIYGTEMTEALLEIESQITHLKKVHVGTGKTLKDSKSLDEVIAGESDELLDDYKDAKQNEALLYIYTSGTTGFPKAAILTHTRFIMMACGVKTLISIKDEDVIYTPLPLYHSAGGILGIGQSILGGSTVVIRSKFSASNYFADCVRYKCTVAQYIGEVCRYILATPQTQYDSTHSVRMIFGNGIKASVWTNFVKRFGVKQIAEFYGATEGNASTINAWNKVGAVGYVPWFAKTVYPVELIRVNEETNEPIRGESGLCSPCLPGEPGLLVGKIVTRTAASRFNGYLDKEATKKKILENVFVKGDKAFNSGDILVKDEWGYLYFRDRTGDTFRWKGENVSTTEVEDAVSKIVGLKDATVYGVEIPNVEGKAGMIALADPDGVLNLNQLSTGIKNELSSYARPIFLRILDKLPVTGTFKVLKLELQKEGYDPVKIKDPIYYLDAKKNEFIRLDSNLYNDILSNRIKL